MSESFVIDNSVVMSWCFKDEKNNYSDQILDKLEFSTAIVPSIWPLEVGNVLLVAERKNRLIQADSIRFIALLTELPIVFEPESPGRMMNEIVNIARAYNLSTYDASYLDLSMRKGISIATLDKNLLKAAKQSKVSLVTI